MNRFHPRPARLGAAVVATVVLAMGAALPGARAASAPVPGGAPWQTFDGTSEQASAADAMKRGADAGVAKVGKLGGIVRDAMDFSKTLSPADQRFEQDYALPGAPTVPSKCLENKACRPCYTEAYGKVDKTRLSLERVRARYAYTHGFTTKGIALMQSAGAAGGGLAGMEATHQSIVVGQALDDFDGVVRKKNAELLARLQGELRGVGQCEAKYYKTDDWYDRYGYMYYQFMVAQYGYAASYAPK